MRNRTCKKRISVKWQRWTQSQQDLASATLQPHLFFISSVSLGPSLVRVSAWGLLPAVSAWLAPPYLRSLLKVPTEPPWPLDMKWHDHPQDPKPLPSFIFLQSTSYLTHRDLLISLITLTSSHQNGSSMKEGIFVLFTVLSPGPRHTTDIC